MSAFKPRIHVLLASGLPLAVVIRRGPSKWACTMMWDRSTDEFRLGQWLKGRIYPFRSDLSPDGKYLLYFALNGKWKEEARGSWTAISRAPYLKAIALFPQGDTWFGGGLFTGERTYWTDSTSRHSPLRNTDEVNFDPKFLPAKRSGHQFTNAYENRLTRDGWTLVNASRIDIQPSFVFYFQHIQSLVQRFRRYVSKPIAEVEIPASRASELISYSQARFPVYEKSVSLQPNAVDLAICRP